LTIWVIALIGGIALAEDGNEKANHWGLGTGWLVIGMCLMSFLSWASERC